MGITGILLIFLSAVVACWGRPDGAPSSACSLLTPKHGTIEAQTTASPYTVSAEKNGNKIRVTISSPNAEEFQGFMIQARSSEDTSQLVEGAFRISKVSKTVNCFNGKQNTLTHVNTDSKTEIITKWTPAANVDEDVIFRATVLKKYDLFWTDIDSSPVRALGPQVNVSIDEKENQNTIYEGCYVTVGCFGLPSGCIAQKNCSVLLSYSKVSEGIQFKMQGYVGEKVYLAMGLSKDGIMGDDDVTQCYNDNSRVITGTSYNSKDKKQNVPRNELHPYTYTTSYSDGLMTCSWISPFSSRILGETRDLENEAFYVLLATGDVRDNGSLYYHTSRVPSNDRINFTSIDSVEMADSATSSADIPGESEESFLHNSSHVSFTDATTEAIKKTGDKHIKTAKVLNGSWQLSFNHVFMLALLQIVFCKWR